MNKIELVADVAKKTGMTKKDTEVLVNTIFAEIVDAVKGGDKVALIGFGSFEGRKRAARKGHNPATGKEINIAASTAPVFKAGKAFKDAVN